MKRDMELVRKILKEIEEKYVDRVLFNLKIDSFEMKVVAYHCDIIYQAGLVKYYKAMPADDGIYGFRVGGLSWHGQDYLEQIRNDDIWDKTMKEIEEKNLPKKIDIIAKIAGIFTGNVINEMNG